ncbi:lipid kinase [Paenarthrobacter aurescens]|uniref:Lipid kinase n=1 Tax=Paenarthrobacter aurescens TaxID=43663 RepID=A0A4Y3NI81_PAEAU|nr:lipid kinase [Paenarthrobacter aurescens]MDO6142828.1 lipid kinase [Paenarthrobacter aurescens]MDO6146673.1 lipid kinase [Paenarthrobacter aurescens]MDO6157919.1 lipid kinase [Paenarthrobacter aurescens]MDO6161904.1 lipid kinase [Paenarthrobacter aurescens]GEB18768.1 lipid kinase [Paenarthrobacter aurescens]
MKLTREARSIAVVINAGSRKGSAARELVVQSLGKAGLPVSAMYTVDGGGDLNRTLERALAEGHDLVVVGGGDGTVASAAGLVAGTDVALGVLPLGTANDLARTLDIPKDLGEACKALAEGKIVDIDLGRANGQPFLNVASAGLSVAVTQALSPRLKRLIGPLAYGVATVRSYAKHKPFHARLEFPEGDHPPVELENLLQVAVGNGRYYGGGNAVSPTAGIDDHTLDIYAILMAPLREQAKIARSLKNGKFVENERVYHLTSRSVRLVTTPPLPVNLDGEITTGTPTDFTVERNAVHVVVPGNSSSATFEGRG